MADAAPAIGQPATAPGVDASTGHLLARLDAIRLAVGELVAARRAVDALPDDPFLGLYLSDDRIDELLRTEPLWVASTTAAERRRTADEMADRAIASGTVIRIRELRTRFELDDVDVELLLITLAPDIDERFERYYGYLNDDVGRRRASVALALGLSGQHPWQAKARARFGAEGRLVAGGLVEVLDADRPLLTRALRAPDRVIAHLLGDDRPDTTVADLLLDVSPTGELEHAGAAALLAGDTALVYFRDVNGNASTSGVDSAVAAGRPAIVMDLDRLIQSSDVATIVRAAIREARLGGAVLVLGPVDAMAEHALVELRELLQRCDLVVAHGRSGWSPTWSSRTPLATEPQTLDTSARQRLWRAALDRVGDRSIDAAGLTAAFRLGAEQIRAAADAAAVRAAASRQPVTDDDVRAGARQQNAARLERLAQRIEPAVAWDDLVLPPTSLGLLRGLVRRARYRSVVLGDWRMRPGGARGTGITALFAGDSGTGKTMSAEVIAAELGLDLYVVNLATVVDKYIGETEKNLDRIFSEADNVNGVLLFDEADALFGQRSEVSDSHDRYANIEVAYLLQRMEQFDGLAVLSTNLRSNIDEAFMRRLDMIIDFPVPDAAQRRLLWQSCLARLRLADDVDLDFCARAFDLTGGNVRSIAITIAYALAAEELPVSMDAVIVAVAEEYRKLGRLCSESEFGRYWPLIAPQTPSRASARHRS